MTMDSLERLVQKFNLKKQCLILSLLEGVGFIAVYFDNAWPSIALFMVLNLLTAHCFGFRSARRSEAIARYLQSIAPSIAKAVDNALNGIVGAVQKIVEMSEKIAMLTSLQAHAGVASRRP